MKTNQFLSWILFVLSGFFCLTSMDDVPMIRDNQRSILHLTPIHYQVGEVYNTAIIDFSVLFKNECRSTLKIESAEFLNKKTVGFYGPYIHSVRIGADSTYHFEFKKRRYETKYGTFTDEYNVRMADIYSNQRYELSIYIHYTFLRNQSFLEWTDMNHVDVNIDQEKDTFLIIRNTGPKVVQVEKIMSNGAIDLDSLTPFKMASGASKRIPIRIRSGGNRGCYNYEIKMKTDEPITVENPTTQIQVSGAVLGENQPKIIFDTKVVSREMQERGDGRFEFWFTNTGQLPLIISQVKSSCGCLVPSYTREPVEPGERGVVIGQYDTRRIGPFTKTMTVLTNAYCKGIVLRIKGDVEPLSRERTIEKGESVIEK